MKNVLSIDELNHMLNSDQDLCVIDCRFELGHPNAGESSYKEGHIPGAVFFDLEKDCSSPARKHGGRHPLPNIETFCKKLGQAGINEHTSVVVYDDQGQMNASRFWFLMTYLGHTHTYILNGGYSAWVKTGLKTTKQKTEKEKTVFIPRLQTHLVVNVDEVKAKLNDPSVILLDSREKNRYLGLQEPIDKVAGHIPNAIHCFFKDGLDEQGYFKTLDEQKKRFDQIDQKKEIIVYCGSGVSACPNVFVLNQIGYPNIKLYVGSWSDWSSYDELPITSSKREG